MNLNIDSPLRVCPKAELYQLMDAIATLAAEFHEWGGYNCSLGQAREQICAEFDRRDELDRRE